MPIAINESLPLSDQLDLLHTAVEDGNKTPTIYHAPGQGLVEIGKALTGDLPWTVHKLQNELLNARLRRWARPEKTVTQRGVQTQQEQPELRGTLVKAYAQEPVWPGVPLLSRIAEAPVVRPDLSICWDEGYDTASRTYVRRSEGAVSAFSTEEAAVAAGKYLLTWFDPFALAFQSSRADLIALALTPLLMSYTRALGEANIPGGIMTADEKGSGKTELARLVALMGTGLRVKPTAWTNPTEVAKRVESALNGSKPVVVFDNVRTSLESDAIESLLTSRSVSARKFGTQSELELINDTLWMFTSNAPEVSPDMLRRLVVVPLSKRGFEGKWDPRIVEKAWNSRGQIMSALTTMVANWARLGAPEGSISMSGYEVWSETMSGILEAAEVEGFGEARAEAAATVVSTEEEDMGHMVGRIARIMGITAGPRDRWTTKQLYDRVIVGDDVGSLADPDFVTVRGWLERGTSANKAPTMVMGRKLSSIGRRDFPDVPYRLEKHANPANSYSIVYTGKQVTRPAEAAGNSESSVSTALDGDN